MTTYMRALRARRARGDKGAALIEAAIAFPLFFLIVLSVIEFGFYMAASSTTTSAGRDGARLGSAEIGPASSKVTVADKIRDRSVTDLRTLNNNDTPVLLWVYKAYTDGSPCATLTCTAGTAFATCPNTVCYRYTAWDNSTKTFTLRNGSWTTMDACAPSIDTVGVYLQVTHNYMSGILGSAATLNEHTVLRMEPLPNAQCP